MVSIDQNLLQEIVFRISNSCSPMRPPKDLVVELAQQWIEKVKIDFDVATYLNSKDSKFFETVAFHCQQAAEKFLKAYLVSYQIEFPKTHDIEKLLELVSERDSELANQLKIAKILSPYSVEMCYPGEYPAITPS